MLLIFICVFFLYFSMPYFETSAATGLNTSKAIEKLLDLVMIRMESAIEQQLLNNNVTKLTQNGHKGGHQSDKQSCC